MQRSVPVTAALCLALALGVCACAVAAPRMVRLPYWKMDNGMMQIGSTREPLVAAADRLVVELGAPAPAGIVTSQFTMSRAAGIASAAGGRATRLLAGGALAVVELPPGTDLHKAAELLRAAGAQAVQPDMEVWTTLVPNDPRYPDQYHHPIINTPPAWDITTGAGDVVIAVVDSGLDTDHPDFVGRLWTNPGEVPGNGKDDDRNGYIDDVHGYDFRSGTGDPNPTPDGKDNNSDGKIDEQVNHGTLVAGIAAATGNNGFGTAGISWGAKIMALKVFPDDGTTTVSMVVEAIDYAVDNGADIINLSIGASYDTSFTPPIVRAHEAGICVVSAGGNSGRALTNSQSSWASPVCNDGPNPLTDNYVLGVAGLAQDQTLAWYSNWDVSTGNFIDVSAPGSNILGPGYYDPTFPAFSTYETTNSGTSFACPMVTGLCALVLAHNPGFTPAQVYTVIRNSADNIDHLNPSYAGALGMGRINCARALGAVAAPAAVTNLTAVDTPDDNGGSVTVGWTKSADDGSGAGTLMAYLLLRGTSPDGPFTQIQELPPGSTGYVDTDVTDGRSYYYIVRTTDGERFAESTVAGPAVPANDSKPDAVSSLTVVDRPDDDGGAVVVDWSGYVAPEDFASYRVYRSVRDFTSTSALTPVATITNVATQTFVDQTTIDGVDYYYAVGVRDTASNENRAIRATGPVQSYPNNPIAIGPGLLFIGPAAVPADRDAATLLNVAPQLLQAARWDTAADRYAMYSPGNAAAAMRLALGRGFWALLEQATVIHPEGSTAPAGNFAIQLTAGWHQLANPFFGPIDFGSSTVTANSNTMDLASAETAGVFGAFAWTYSTNTNEYVLAYPDLGHGERIPAWSGFWVKALSNCVLSLPRPADTDQAGVSGVTTAADSGSAGQGWRTRVVLRTAEGADTQNYIGAAPAACEIPSPPAIDARPQLVLGRANVSSEAGRLAVSLGAQADADWRWDIRVSDLTEGQQVEVMLPDLSGVPSTHSVLLYDGTAGRSVSMRTSHSYRFCAGAEGVRELVLQVAQADAGALQIGTLSAQASSAGGAQVVFSLSQPAETSVEVLNIAGRTVRKVEEGHLRLAGIHTIVFDGRNSGGALVPAGRYLVAVAARAENGQQVRRMMTVNLSR